MGFYRVGVIVSGFFSLPELWYNFSVTAKGWELVIVVFSIVVSFVLGEIFSNNKDVRVWARGLFGIKIPLICLVLVREYYILYNVLNIEDADTAAVLGGVNNIKNMMMIPYYNFCVVAKRWIPVIVTGFHACGMVLYDVFKRNREVQKWVVSRLILAIPIFSIVLIYMLGFLYGVVS